MKNKLNKLVFASLLLLAMNAGAQWLNSGPEGGMVLNVVQNGSTLVCLTPGGLYSSADNGTTWTPSRSGIPFVEVRTLASSSGKFLAGSGNGTYASTDGQNWTLQGGNQIKIVGSRGNHVFGISYAIASRTIYHSADGGTTFGATTVNFDLASGFAVIDTTLFIGATNGVKYSINNGISWVALNISPAIGAVTDIQPAIGGGLLIAAGGNVYKHNGSIFSTSAQMANGIPSVFAASKLGVLNNKYLLSVGDKMGYSPFHLFMKSADGLAWTIDSQAFISRIFGFQTFGSNSFICSSKGLYKSTDNGVTWIRSEAGIKAHSITDVKSDNNKLYAAVNNTVFSNGFNLGYGGNLFSSSDAGATWKRLSLPDTLGVKRVFAEGNKIIVFASSTWGFGTTEALFRSTDTGATWSMITGTTVPPYNSNLHMANGALYLTSPSSFDKSTDFGATWTNIPMTGFPGTAQIGIDGIGTNLFVNTSLYINFNGGVYTTTNGTAWSQCNNGFDNNMVITKLRAIGTSLFAIQQNTVSGVGTAIHRSTNNAANWSNITGALPQHYYSDVYGWSGNLFVSTCYSINGSMVQMNGIDSGAVYGSTDNGTTWINISTGLPSVSFGNMAVSNSKLYVATNGYSIWSRAVTPNGNVGVAGIAGKKSNIQCYPNPSTGILYFNSPLINEQSEIAVTDIAGKEVINTTLNGSPLNVSALHSGIYFYTIHTGNGVTAKGKFVRE